MPNGKLAAKERLILAVDTQSIDEARRMLDELSEYVGVFKIGLEMLMSAGLPALNLFQQEQRKVFLDGKFLDIPNTVAKASEAVARAGVTMFTVHASGGQKMLAQCVQAASAAASAAGKTPPIALGVTVLTSLDQKTLNNELNVPGSTCDQVINLAGLCARAGVQGVVASPQEIAQIRAKFGSSLLIVTPGIRPAWAESNDQSRITTPGDAIASGADYLVVGRPITAAANRKDAAMRIIEEIEQALETAV